ncbi:transposase [bacterium]|nr:transposase [bacterium]
MRDDIRLMVVPLGCYWCPAGQKLIQRGQREKNGKLNKSYSCHSCRTCSMKSQCTKAKGNRRIYRWIHEDIAEQVQARVRGNPDKMNLRKALVEHPFGTMKRAMGHSYELMVAIQ